MFISLLVPSRRGLDLINFLNSARSKCLDRTNIEYVIAVDKGTKIHLLPASFDYYNIKVMEVPPGSTMSELDQYCYSASKGDWVFFCNDDVIVETENWDEKIREATLKFPDDIGLIWPNDNMFCQTLSCFPIVSRKVMEMIGLFPLPYKRYKIDDTIFELFPPDKRLYLSDVIFRHNNDKGETGYRLPDGRRYPVDSVAGNYDQAKWMEELPRRTKMKEIVATALGLKAVRLPADFKCMIAVPTCEFARQAIFYDHYNQIQKPVGTICGFAHGQSPAYNRNLMIQQALDTNCTHILFIDDDMLVQPDVLIRLASHDKDIVSGLYLMRNYPHTPVIFESALDDGRCMGHLLSNEENGLIPIVNAGLGLVMIKTDVFRAMEKPWIRLGQIDTDQWCDDIEFFNRVRKLGYKMWCDLECQGGHMASVAIWPKLDNGKWTTCYNTQGTATVSTPQLTADMAVRS